LQDGAKTYQELRGSGQLRAEARIDVCEHGNHFHQQENGNADGHDGDNGGVHHRGFNFLAKAGRVFQVSRQPGEDFRQQTAPFTGCHHANIEAVKSLWMFLQGFGKTVAAFNARADIADDITHHFVWRLIGQSLQGLNDGQTGINHGCQLARENHQIREPNAAATSASLFSNFSLN
jgi:hypothetical protein